MYIIKCIILYLLFCTICGKFTKNMFLNELYPYKNTMMVSIEMKLIICIFVSLLISLLFI
jgi:hypothetical protein